MIQNFCHSKLLTLLDNLLDYSPTSDKAESGRILTVDLEGKCSFMATYQIHKGKTMLHGLARTTLGR